MSSSGTSTSTHTSASTSSVPSIPSSTTTTTSPGIPVSTEEHFDVLSSTGDYLGYAKPRKLVHKDGDWHASVHIWIIHKYTGKILLQKRAACKDSFPSCWDVSSAGHLSAGETALEAARAELFEELGISSSPASSIEHPPSVNEPSTVNTHHAVSRGRVGHLSSEQVHTSVEEDKSKTAEQTDSFFHYLTTLPRAITSQNGKFVDNEHVHVYYVFTSLETHQLTLQVEEVEATKYIDLDDYLDILQKGSEENQQKQQNADATTSYSPIQHQGELYVPFPDLAAYQTSVFTVLREKAKACQTTAQQQHTTV